MRRFTHFLKLRHQCIDSPAIPGVHRSLIRSASSMQMPQILLKDLNIWKLLFKEENYLCLKNYCLAWTLYIRPFNS